VTGGIPAEPGDFRERPNDSMSSDSSYR
jgi:hypothetical protein